MGLRLRGRRLQSGAVAHPQVNLTGDAYLTDGLRLVLFLKEPHQALDQIEVLDWER